MKPIAWYDPTNGMVSTDKDSPLFTPLGQVLPLYLQTEQEPVAWGMEQSDGEILDVITPEEHARLEGGYTVPLYRHPQRTWVGLTDEDIGMCLDAGDGSMSKIISFIEAKLKDKNT